MQRVNYDPLTGEFTWTKGRNAGKRAGCRNPSSGYRYLPVYGKDVLISEHTLAWFMTHDELPTHAIDHVNRVNDDNRLCNLRDVPHSDNLHNRGLLGHNTSGVTGVSWNKSYGKWEVRLTRHGKRHFLGRFNDKNEAIAAREKAEEMYLNH